MNEILDQVWAQFEIILDYTVSVLGSAISPMEILGPGFVVFFLALAVVLFTRFVSKAYVTKRYTRLKKEFKHWQAVREEAFKHPDPEKARTLARNIDQAKLNRVYYDYFFEGMLKNMVTNVLPILLTAAFVTKIYDPDGLMARFGEKWIFSFSIGKTAVTVSSLFWYVISLLICFVFYAIIKTIVTQKRNHQTELAQSNI